MSQDPSELIRPLRPINRSLTGCEPRALVAALLCDGERALTIQHKSAMRV